ncbi:hypothetical protein PHLH4_24080 [Pseudomonas sp. St316]|nr:hypothetical protein PHLH4_24080 [Pseudomonas sp. St316]
MSINLDQAQQTFIVEAREQLQAMEESLLQLETDPGDDDAIGAIFRAAHTIKGSAGLFGLEPIVSFTHIVEDVLDRLRNGSVEVDAGLIAVLLKSSDHMLELINVAANQGGTLPPPALQREVELCQILQEYQAPSPTAAPTPVHEIEAREPGVARLWHISLRFGQDVFRNGMDPLSFLRYLQTLGEIVDLITLTDALPAADAWDAESCYLGFDIEFRSAASHGAINEVFDFVREDCVIEIVALDDIASPANTGLVTTSPEPAEESTALIATGELLSDQRKTPRVPAQIASDKQTVSSDSKAKDGTYVRVNADKLDELINLVGELVIASAGTSLLARTCNNDPLQESTSTVSSLVEEILDGALRLRMIPIGETFNRFRRVVRDVSQELGKDIDLIISGAETELDKTVVEKIGDPLMHLLRNAMDHGIETAEARLAAGKPAKGHLHLNAYHDSGSIVLEIADDGAGLNRDRILEKAQERGLVPRVPAPPTRKSTT